MHYSIHIVRVFLLNLKCDLLQAGFPESPVADLNPLTERVLCSCAYKAFWSPVLDLFHPCFVRCRAKCCSAAGSLSSRKPRAGWRTTLPSTPLMAETSSGTVHGEYWRWRMRPMTLWFANYPDKYALSAVMDVDHSVNRFNNDTLMQLHTSVSIVS